jgi:hypothetical protein
LCFLRSLYGFCICFLNQQAKITAEEAEKTQGAQRKSIYFLYSLRGFCICFSIGKAFKNRKYEIEPRPNAGLCDGQVGGTGTKIILTKKEAASLVRQPLFFNLKD